MKFSVFTVMTPDLTPEELVAALEEYGYDGVEWRMKDVPESATNEAPSFWGNNRCSIGESASDDELDRFRILTHHRGLSVVGVTPYLATGDLVKTERVMQAAKKLGAGQIRIGIPPYGRGAKYDELFSQAVDYLRGVEALSGKYKVKGLVETHHGTIAPSVGLAFRLVNGLDPDRVGVLLDPGNMVHEGYEDYRMGMELLGPYLAHVHVKNACWVRGCGGSTWHATWCPLDGGIVDWKRVVADLKSVGYDGYLGFEDFSGVQPPRVLLKQNIEYLRSLL
ncbi:sugar phosphate isomerase/epimerase [Melghirimyces profundicolus]|uniref:Sugar phosphate isomerase/epimerase n=1 Tax=Melghirimyces profundicolus TaxID=1242148 RepID=A0A2T6C9H6_9BACL|nr:sugar phosphate isomerase/epimerase family protein [Melghirimyces profundicolus]PTX64951.1 sugar phosphate isomerase/epimerase [Melghirimyces profundicolus]